MNQSQTPLLENKIVPLIFQQALPLFFAGLLISSYHFVDLFLSSKTGSVQIAAVAFVSPFFLLLQSLDRGLSQGGVSVIGKLIGQGKEDVACSFASLLRLVIIVLGIFFSVAGVLLIPFILLRLSLSGGIYTQALGYSRILLFSLPFSMINRYYMALFKSQGKMVTVLFFIILGLATKGITSYLAVFVYEMGIEGMAYSTIITEVMLLLVFATLFHRTEQNFELKWKIPEGSDWGFLWGRLLWVGLPLSFSLAVVPFSAFLVNFIIASCDAHTVVAAFALGNAALALFFLPVKMIGESFVPLLSQNWGKEAMDRVRRILIGGVLFSFLFGLVGVVVIQINKYSLGAYLSNGDEMVYSLVIDYLGLVAWAAITWSLFCAMQSLFNSFQRTFFTLITTILLWGIRWRFLILFKIYFRSMEERGIWYALLVTHIVVFLIAGVYSLMVVPKMVKDSKLAI